MADRPKQCKIPNLAVALWLLVIVTGAKGMEVLEQARALRGQDPQTALTLLERHIAEPGELEPDHHQARLLELRAGILRDLGRRDEAWEDAERLQHIAQALGDPVRQARAEFLLGTIQAERGDIAGALERFHSARGVLQGNGNEAELARVTNAIGVAHNFTNNYPRARDYYQQALELARRAGNVELENTILGNLALVIGELDGPRAGLAAHREALALAHERDDGEMVANQLANICSRLVEVGQLDPAATTCSEALRRVEALGNARLVAGTRMSLGDLDRARGNLEAARGDYEAALALAQNLVPSVEVELLEKLANLDAALGAPERALQRLRQLMALRARLQERQRASLIEELEVRYRVEQQEREIELLELDRELQASQLRQRNQLLIGSGIALVLVTLLMLVAWRGYSSKSRLERELATRNDALGEALATITRLAREDALTGLLNRRGFRELAEREIQRAGRTGEPLALVMADIDQFKRINDQHGHAVGDEILGRIAQRMKQSVRDLDIVCRWGGEEFVLLLPRTDKTDARRAIDRIRDRLGARPIDTSAGPFTITLTYGIATVDSDLDAAIEHADKAMYQGKRAGRDGVVTHPAG